MRHFANATAFGARVEQWLLPPVCLLCRAGVAPIDHDALVCAVCRARWEALPEPQCVRCGQPSVSADPCRGCQGWSGDLERAGSAVWLDDGARRTVHALKYQGWWRVASSMARVMVPLLPRHTRPFLVPIPLGRARERRRGYNQSLVLARALGHLTTLPVAGDLLRRARDTNTQTALTPDARVANVAGAFHAGGRAGGRPVVLVDDVFTTGATLLSAARALKLAGVSQVEAITFARARLPLAGLLHPKADWSLRSILKGVSRSL